MPASTLLLAGEPLRDAARGLIRKLSQPFRHPVGLCGFDGFVDTLIRMESPSTMAEFGPKVAAAAGIAASYQARHSGDQFGGNGPLLSSAVHQLFRGEIDLTYIGALGYPKVLPIFSEALHGKMEIISIADPAHSDCLEFTDGKIMLCDLQSCSEITWERLLEVTGDHILDLLLARSDFIGAVNWGKLPHAGIIWENLALRLAALGRPAKELHFFMDLAEFETRPTEEREALVESVRLITRQCRTLLSFNLKEAWQMGELFGHNFHGQRAPEAVMELAVALREGIGPDRLIIHPNDGAACASETGVTYAPGPYCEKPLVSTGAGDHFGGGCLMAALLGFSDAELLLAGNCSSGHYVRTGRSPGPVELAALLKEWLVIEEGS